MSKKTDEHICSISEGGIAAAHPTQPPTLVEIAPSTFGEFNTVRAAFFPVACWRVKDIRFDLNSSFVKPDIVDEMTSLAKLVKNYTMEGRKPALSIFGHADPKGNDNYNKKLSGRRAAAIYGMITRDTEIWEDIYSNKGIYTSPLNNDQWGMKAIQTMLAALDYSPGAINGEQDEQTTEAINAFQAAQGLAENGTADTQTRAKLFLLYMDRFCRDENGKPFKLDKIDFLARGEDGYGKGDFQGCSEFNPVLIFSQKEEDEFAQPNMQGKRDAENAPNRRVVIYLFRPGTRLESIYWPCPRAKEGIDDCKKRFWSDGKNRRNFRLPDTQRNYEETKDTFACRFYDRIGKGSPCETPKPPIPPPEPPELYDEKTYHKPSGLISEDGEIQYYYESHIRNGHYQDIYWLGIAGYVIINKHAREILMVDPCPSYDKDGKKDIKNLEKFANFLRKAKGKDCKLIGILISHEHWDHTADVACLLELLLPETGNYENHRGLNFKLEGNKFELSELPKICCDIDSKEYLVLEEEGFSESVESSNDNTKKIWGELRYEYKKKKSDKWQMITINGKYLRYEDEYYEDNNIDPPVAGVNADSFDLGDYKIVPYVWDHYSLWFGNDGKFWAAGHYQRQTAFFIKHRKAKNAQRTFISGSAGEMNEEFTGNKVKQVKLLKEDDKGNKEEKPFEVELFIQSIPQKIQNWFLDFLMSSLIAIIELIRMERFGDRLNALVSYQVENIKVNNFIVCSHWESFIRKAATKLWGEDFENVERYINELEKQAKEKLKLHPEREDLIDIKKKVYILGRTGFECGDDDQYGLYKMGLELPSKNLDKK